jgi:uncharacterized membrane protein YdbT with pleckstrin-like domain
MANERPVWSGTPSQVLNLPTFVLCGLFCWLVIPIFIALWQWLVLRYTQYELTTERLRIRHGVLSKKLDELGLYRVRDYELAQPLWMRPFGLGNITLQTSDRSHPVVVLRAIRNGEQVREQIRRAVEDCRVTKRVRELDVE